MPNQAVLVEIETTELILSVDDTRVASVPFKLPAAFRTLSETRLADLRATNSATALFEGNRAGSSGQVRAALTQLETLLRDGHNYIRGLPSYRITEPDRLMVFTSYGWDGGLIGDFTDARVEFLANQAALATPQIVNAAYRYPQPLRDLIAAQLVIVNANQPTATGGEAQVATAARDAALLLLEAANSRARYFYCFASDDRDQTPELARIGFQPRRDPGDAETQPLPDQPGPVTFDAVSRTVTLESIPLHATSVRVFRQAAGGPPQLITTSQETTIPLTNAEPFTPGVTYQLWVVGANSRGEGPESNHVTHVAT